MARVVRETVDAIEIETPPDSVYTLTPTTVGEVRQYFINELGYGNFVVDKTGCKMVELVGASFLADEPAIFGKPNDDYIARETEWYLSQRCNVNDFPGEVPTGWKQVAGKDGEINSNYGWCVFSEDNHFQYANVYQELRKNPYSRRAVMIYQRPSMWDDYKRDGMSDFICTNAHQYLIRDGVLNVVVQMRSNDVVWGYKNDYAWARYVQDKLAVDLGVPRGTITWQAGSLHVYEKHFHLVK